MKLWQYARIKNIKKHKIKLTNHMHSTKHHSCIGEILEPQKRTWVDFVTVNGIPRRRTKWSSDNWTPRGTHTRQQKHLGDAEVLVDVVLGIEVGKHGSCRLRVLLSEKTSDKTHYYRIEREAYTSPPSGRYSLTRAQKLRENCSSLKVWFIFFSASEKMQSQGLYLNVEIYDCYPFK